MPEELIASAAAMATRITVRVPHRAGDHVAEAAVADALSVFTTVERSCTRFDPASALMRANASPRRFHRLPKECLLAVRDAHAAYEATHGVFDPRVLGDLVGLGYTSSLRFSAGMPDVAGLVRRRAPLGPWRPRFRGEEVALGEHPIELGGIGKGVAIRLAAALLAERGLASFFLEVGGDLYCAGEKSEGGMWRVGVEDPLGGDEHRAVIELSDLACATSSLRVRRWLAGGQPAHHLIDPRTGLPGGGGLCAVTVVAHDPAWAEVWSKTLLLAGARLIERRAEARALAALWVSEDGELRWSRAMEPRVVWWRAAVAPA